MSRHAKTVARVLAGVIAALLSFSALARAQGMSSERVYVTASVLGDLKWFSGDPSDPRFNGHDIGGALTIGSSVAPRWDLQLDVDLPRFSRTSRTTSVTFQRSTISMLSVAENQAISVGGLVRFRSAPHGHLQLGYLAGLSFVRVRRDFHSEAPAGTPTALIPRATSSVDFGAAPTLGLDVRIAVTGHLSIVPGIRAAVFSLPDTSGVLLRPRLGIRWSF